MNKLLLLILLIVISFLILVSSSLSYELESFKNNRLERNELENRIFKDELRLKAFNKVSNIRFKLKPGYNHGKFDLSKLSHV